LSLYHEQTKPLVDFYQARQSSGVSVRVAKVNGVASVDEIKDEISSTLD